MARLADKALPVAVITRVTQIALWSVIVGLSLLLHRPERHSSELYSFFLRRGAVRQPSRCAWRLAAAAHQRRDRRPADWALAILRGGETSLPSGASLERAPLPGECRDQCRVGDPDPAVAAQQLRFPHRDRWSRAGLDRNDRAGLRGRALPSDRPPQRMDDSKLRGDVWVRLFPASAERSGAGEDCHAAGNHQRCQLDVLGAAAPHNRSCAGSPQDSIGQAGAPSHAGAIERRGACRCDRSALLIPARF